MSQRSPLESAERAALWEEPPRDEEGRLVPWALAHRSIENERIGGAVEHEGLTLDDVVFKNFRWAGAVFKGCVLRGVSFEEVELSGVRFEDVTFEGCSLQGVQLDECTLTRCRFAGGSMAGWRVKRSTFARCAFEEIAGESWTLLGSTLEGCSFRGSTLLLLRLSKCVIDALDFQGGSLEGAEIGMARAGALRITGASVTGLRFLGGEIREVALTEVSAQDLSFSTSEVGLLSLQRCPSVSALRVVGGRLGALHMQQCAGVQGLQLFECALRDLAIYQSALHDTVFEGVVSSGASRFDGSALTGLFFKQGTWASVHLHAAQLGDYVAVEGAAFTWLDPAGVREAPGVHYRIEGVSYGLGSMTWGASRGP